VKKRLTPPLVEIVLKETGIARSRIGIGRDTLTVLALDGTVATLALTLAHTESSGAGMQRIKHAILEAMSK
jgi:hypothetical protein